MYIISQSGIDSLSTEELALLSKGGRMWEEGSTTQKRKFGVFGDILNIINAVAGMFINTSVHNIYILSSTIASI